MKGSLHTLRAIETEVSRWFCPEPYKVCSHIIYPFMALVLPILCAVTISYIFIVVNALDEYRIFYLDQWTGTVHPTKSFHQT